MYGYPHNYVCQAANRSHVRVSITLCQYNYGLSKFQVYNYDSWITIKNKINNVSESNVRDESRKAAGNVLDFLTMRENCDNVEFSHDELNAMLKYVCTK